jgi:pyridoxal/pyridoxine/pyridoxamine kinase
MKLFFFRLLSGKSVKTVDDAWVAMETFHDQGCKIVIISSSELGAPCELLTLASSIKSTFAEI